ncbi:hypothetical protein CABS01_13411 [Colletotrichum abscissum]|uniref:Uncharacterized protein n=1 Tax=Colletotrichum abscissum TaxID=1671311 RepID=A0A9P9XSU7_9PEZI|nr:uncharacterized protein CABS01_13411 [Colletotrichum abscissum]KAI3559690.1 hypothetical protein CABS02_00665 [Colletotrichum abscissum]KAK1486194.1 hypothetical protein CABS01_13411 [Colletotrichum abscissum]
MLNRRGPISKIVGSAVDAAKKFQGDQKQPSATQKTNNVPIQPVQAGQSVASGHTTVAQHQATGDDSDVDEDWTRALDEAQLAQSQSSGNQHGVPVEDIEGMLTEFIVHHPPPETSNLGSEKHGLPMPVILPQRRPESRHRGFVRAYAPVLQECGIDQAAWLGFLDGFENSIKGSPWFGVVNAGVMGADLAHTVVGGFAPITMLVTLSVQTGLEASRRGYVNYKQNNYLEVMNENFFKPRGLYALVVKYKPSSSEVVENIDLDHNITQAVEGSEKQSKWKKLLHSGSSTTKSEAEIPEPAPLVFPQLDKMDEGQKQNMVKKFGDSISKYYDRKATDRFRKEHPDSKLMQEDSSEEEGLEASSSTEGHKGPIRRLKQRRQERFEASGRERKFGKEAREKRKRNRPLKKLMRQDALYLMVVNLPTSDEMDAVLAQVEGQ